MGFSFWANSPLCVLLLSVLLLDYLDTIKTHALSLLFQALFCKYRAQSCVMKSVFLKYLLQEELDFLAVVRQEGYEDPNL